MVLGSRSRLAVPPSGGVFVHDRLRPRPRGLGLATATTSATLFPHCEHRIRVARAASVTDLPTIRASALGSMCLDAPHGQVTRTMKSPRASSSFVMWGSTRMPGRSARGGRKPRSALTVPTGVLRSANPGKPALFAFAFWRKPTLIAFALRSELGSRGGACAAHQRSAHDRSGAAASVPRTVSPLRQARVVLLPSRARSPRPSPVARPRVSQ